MSTAIARLSAIQRRGPLMQIVAIVVIFTFGTVTLAGFNQEQSIRSMLVLASLLGLAAAGQTLVLLIGGLDLSVPGLIVLGATITTELSGSWGFVPAFLFILVVCGATGAFVGWISHKLRILPLIITLAVSGIALGAVQVWTHSRFQGTAPQFLTNLVSANGTTFGIAVAPIVVIWIGFTIFLALVLHRARVGRRLFLTGANPRAAELSLIRTRWVTTGVYAASAMMSGVVGVLLAGFSGTDIALGDPYLFTGLTAVIVGGTAFRGARGDYTHTALGALILTMLTTIMVGNNYDTSDQQIVYGILILIVVAAYGRESRLRDRV